MENKFALTFELMCSLSRLYLLIISTSLHFALHDPLPCMHTCSQTTLNVEVTFRKQSGTHASFHFISFSFYRHVVHCAKILLLFLHNAWISDSGIRLCFQLSNLVIFTQVSSQLCVCFVSAPSQSPVHPISPQTITSMGKFSDEYEPQSVIN